MKTSDFNETLERYRLFFANKLNDRILATIRVLPSGWKHAETFAPDIELMFKSYEEQYRLQRFVRDDSIPVIAPCFGTGQFIGFFGKEIRFENGSCWAEPILTDGYDKLAELHFNENTYWTEQFKNMLISFQEWGEDRFCYGVSPGICPLDWAQLIRGTRIYTDYYDCPDLAKNLLNITTEACIKFHNMQVQILKRMEDGFAAGYNDIWYPGNMIDLAIDESVLVSQDLFEEFGIPYIQIVLEHCDAMTTHIHTAGLHVLPLLKNLKKLKLIRVGKDPNAPGVLEAIRSIRKILGDIPIVTGLEYGEFLDGLRKGSLAGGVMYVTNSESIEQADSIIKLVRKYRSTW